MSDPNDIFYQHDEDILYCYERYMPGELQVMFEDLNLQISLKEIRRGFVNYGTVLVQVLIFSKTNFEKRYK